MRLTDGLRRSTHFFPDRLATLCEGRRTCWRTLGARVPRLAAGLVEGGLEVGDRVYILALNSDHYVEAYYAILWAGGTPVPGNTRWSTAEHVAAAHDSEPTLLLHDRAFAEAAADIASELRLGLLVMDGGAGSSWDEMAAGYTPIEDRSGADDDLALIFYTGGTTGRSKGVMLSHRALITNFLMFSLARGGGAAATYVHAAPMYHLADAAWLFGVTLQGGTHAILPQFEPNAFVALVAEAGADTVLLVPTMFRLLADALEGRKADLSSLTEIVYGASPISTALLARALPLFPNARVIQAYGQTELAPVVTVLDGEHHRPGAATADKLRSAGRAVPLVEIEIRDEAGAPCPPGQIGEVVVRSPTRMTGYWRQPDLTHETLRDGWLKTGDAGRLDEEGFLYVVDRIKDMVISGGENIYSAEVENAIAAHPAVHECAVIGVPDARWGERVHAIVRLKPGGQVDAETIVAHCRTLIAGYKLPRTLEFRVEPFPLSGVNKVLKTELRRLWREDGADRTS